MCPAPELSERVRSGEALLLDVRCKDGGWNYGSAWTLGEDQRSYPETTALALLGLQGRAEAASSVDLAKTWLQDTPSSMARAWITIALRLHGVAVPDVLNPLEGPGSPDLMVVALEALGVPDGNYGLLKTEERMKIRRRDFFPLAGAGLLAGYAGWEGVRSRRNAPAGPSPVVVRQSVVLFRRSGGAHSARRARVRAGCSRSKSSAQAESGGVRSEHLYQYGRCGGRGGLRRVPGAGRGRGHHRRRPRPSPRYLFAGGDGALPGYFEVRRSVRGSEPRRCEPGAEIRRPRRNVFPQHRAAGRSGGFARQDENPSLGRGHALHEEFLRPGSGIGLRLAQERAAPRSGSPNRSWN